MLPPLIGLLLVAALVYVLLRYGGVFSGTKRETGKKWVDPDEAFNAKKKERQDEMDRILEKIEKKGMNSLSRKEKDFLNGL